MKIEITEQFYKDIGSLNPKVKQRIIELINHLEQSTKLDELPSLKKLKGFKNAYRIRMGDYRLGFLFEKDTIKLGRFLNRKDIYKYFP